MNSLTPGEGVGVGVTAAVAADVCAGVGGTAGADAGWAHAAMSTAISASLAIAGSNLVWRSIVIPSSPRVPQSPCLDGLRRRDDAAGHDPLGVLAQHPLTHGEQLPHPSVDQLVDNGPSIAPRLDEAAEAQAREVS